VIQAAGAALRARELGEAVDGHPENVDAALPELAALLAVFTDVDVVLAAVEALSLVSDARAVRLLIPHAADTDENVRAQVAAALSDGMHSEDLRQRVIATLLPMTEDPASSVRDAACFSLGMVNADGAPVREALVARLADDDADTRAEALVSLARTGDPRALEATLALLSGESDAITLQELRAAAELSDPALLPALTVLATNWAADHDEHTELLEKALSRCADDAAERAADIEKLFRAEAKGRLAVMGVSLVLEREYPHTQLRFEASGRPGLEPPSRLWDFMESPDTVDLEVLVSSAELVASHSFAG
jgi:HEAT repeat protein